MDFSVAAQPDADLIRLDALARHLRLTAKQRVYADVLAADPFKFLARLEEQPGTGHMACLAKSSAGRCHQSRVTNKGIHPRIVAAFGLVTKAQTSSTPDPLGSGV